MAYFLLNFDLNQPPPHELQNPLRPIEDRIRYAICATARQAQSTPAIDRIVGVDGEGLRNCKRDKTQLAKALEMDLDADNSVDDHKGGFFDCNICLGLAKDPILTCCGHLFCWPCFYTVPDIDSISKECPVCNGEVTDSNVIPIYGNGNGNDKTLESDFRVRIPPRPKAPRVESVGPQSFDNNNNNNNSVADAIRNLRINLRNRDGNSVVHASVNIQPQDQRYAGSVETDVAVTSTRRRRRRGR